MLIPKYWAQDKQFFESKTAGSNVKKQATIKRYGWSDISQAKALSHAKKRVIDAHNRWLAGEDVVRRERDEQYNESNGIPIREQIIAEHDFPKSRLSESGFPDKNLAITQLIVTRNRYGAQVANVNNIAIIDVDNAELLYYSYPNSYDSQGLITALPANQSQRSTKVIVWSFVIVSALIASTIAWLQLSWLWLVALMLVATAFLWRKASKQEQAHKQKRDTDLASLLPFITDLIQKRVASHPNEQFRLYETPAGFRIIATHHTVLPNDTIVAEWFEYFHADANYVRLCRAQQCFRARLTAKPWRMNEVNENQLDKQIPANNFWFTDTSLDDDSFDNMIDEMDDEQYADFEKQQAKLAARQQWIADYDSFAQGYRACRYIKHFSGQGNNNRAVPKAIDEFIKWHDGACQIDKGLPMA